MSRFLSFSYLLVNLFLSPASYAGETIDELLQRVETQNQESQERIEKSRQNLQQLENDHLKFKAEFELRKAERERLNAETDRLRMINEADEAAKKLQEITEQAEQAALEQEESAKRAEEAAEEIRTQILQANIKQKNHTFLGIVFLSVLIFLWSVNKRYRNEGYMKDFEKFGIVTVLLSGLLILLVLMLSEPWVERFDFIQNLMMVLELHIFPKEDDCVLSCEYFISFPAKYAIFALLSFAAYGFTTYLGITPALFNKKNIKPENT